MDQTIQDVTNLIKMFYGNYILGVIGIVAILVIVYVCAKAKIKRDKDDRSCMGI